MVQSKEIQLAVPNFRTSSNLFNLNVSALQNINKSISDLRPISRRDEQIECANELYAQQPPIYQQFDRFQGGFEGESSASFWNRRYFNLNYVNLNNNFKPKTITNGNRQIDSNLRNSEHMENGQLRNTFSTSQYSIGDFSMNQTEDKRHKSKDSNDKQKRKLTRQYFVTVFSICYAIFLVVFGAIVFIGDVVDSQYPLPQAFCIYMLVMAFAYFLYLYIDIRLYVFHAKKELKLRLERKERVNKYITQNMLMSNESTESNEFRINDVIYEQAIRGLNLPPLDPILHKYCFLTGRNGDSLYLKLGASWFAFGLLVYSALQVSYDAYFISKNGDYLYECASYITLSLNILFPMYSLFTLFFIVKYMHVIINVNQNLARIFLLHSIGTSLALWVFTIVRETADAIAESDSENYGMIQIAQPNDTFEFAYNDCGKSNALNSVHRQFAPYLYPFVIEYCILNVGIWCKIYANINQCPLKPLNESDNEALSSQSDQSNEDPSSSFDYDRTSDHDKDIESTSYVYADCQSSFRGIFVGLLVAIMTIVFIILMFVGSQNKSYLKTSIVINNVFECIVLVILIVSNLFAYGQMVKLDLRFDPILRMDDILLLIAIPAFIMDSFFSLMPAIKNGGALSICIPILRVVQVLIQTPFIVDGKRRCSNSEFLKKRKPGRGFVIFLAIANMSLWIYNTFSGKAVYASDDRYAYYGYTLWNILNHISLPLIMFYRFHSSVCLVDIWNHAYGNEQKPE